MVRCQAHAANLGGVGVHVRLVTLGGGVERLVRIVDRSGRVKNDNLHQEAS